MATLDLKFDREGFIKCCLVVYTVSGDVETPAGKVDVVIVKFDAKFEVEFPETIRVYRTKKKIAFGLVTLENEERDVDKGSFEPTQVKKILLEVANIGFGLVPGLEEGAKKKLMAQLTEDGAWSNETEEEKKE